MHRAAFAPHPARLAPRAGTWLARRWYYTPRTHRAYSVRQVSPGDRRLLAEFVASLSETTPERHAFELEALTRVLFDRVISAGDDSTGFVALENTSGGDRVVGVAAYASDDRHTARFSIAVANSFRDEQVGRTLMSSLIRHAKRVGIPRLTGEMVWSNRAMQVLAMSAGFVLEPLPGDRDRRLIALRLK